MKLTEFDTGLGTSYERCALYSLLDGLAAELQIRSSLEGPIDGITGVNGINSIALARRGVQVTVVLPAMDLIHYAKRFYEAENCLGRAHFICSTELLSLKGQFDLVWNFGCLPQREDYESVLDQMACRSRRYIMIFVSNTWNYGFWIHRMHHVIEKEHWYHGDVQIMNTRKISQALQRLGFRTVRRLFVDVPWWPDIDSPIEEVAASFLPILKPFIKQSRRSETYKYSHMNFPYFHEGRRKALQDVLSSHLNFETTRIPVLKWIFAHHRGILAERI